MHQERRQSEAFDLFSQAADLTREQQEEFVKFACKDDVGLKELVLRLLAQDRNGTKGILRDQPSYSTHADGPPRKPERLGPYQVLDLLGEGGMGTVYRAKEASTSRVVALKLLREGLASPEAHRRLDKEARSLAQLKHPGIAQVYQAGIARDDLGREQRYIAMELVEGTTITNHSKAANLSIAQRVELVARLADAVGHAHQRGVIHRDLKPANILVEPSAGDVIGQPKVLDFGIARLLRSGDSDTTTERDRSLITEAGRIIGTLAYMSPEQLEPGTLGVDTRADIYSLSMVLYEVLAGRPPLDLSRLALPDAARVIREVDPVPLGSLCPSCRGDLETIVRRGIEKERQRRYPSALELAADLRRYLAHEPIVARPATMRYRLGRFVRRNRAASVAAAVTLLALVAGITGVVVGYRNALEASRIAEAQRATAQRESDRLRRGLQFLHDGLVTNAFEHELGPNVRLIDAMTRAASQAGEYFRDDPLSEARVRTTVALIHSTRREHSLAMEQLRRSAELMKSAPLAPQDQIIAVDSFIARVACWLGHVDEARRGAQDLVALASTPPVNPRTLHAQQNLLLMTMIEAGEFEPALALAKQTLAAIKLHESGNTDFAVGVARRMVEAHEGVGETKLAADVVRELWSWLPPTPEALTSRVWIALTLTDAMATFGDHTGQREILGQLAEAVAVPGTPPEARAQANVAFASSLADPTMPTDASSQLAAAQAAHAAVAKLPTESRVRSSLHDRATGLLALALIRTNQLDAAKMLLTAEPPLATESQGPDAPAGYEPSFSAFARAELALATGQPAIAARVAQEELARRMLIRGLWEPETTDAAIRTALVVQQAEGSAAAAAVFLRHASSIISAPDPQTPDLSRAIADLAAGAAAGRRDTATRMLKEYFAAADQRAPAARASTRRPRQMLERLSSSSGTLAPATR